MIRYKSNEFTEELHPRDEAGKFSESSGGNEGKLRGESDVVKDIQLIKEKAAGLNPSDDSSEFIQEMEKSVQGISPKILKDVVKKLGISRPVTSGKQAKELITRYILENQRARQSIEY